MSQHSEGCSAWEPLASLAVLQLNVTGQSLPGSVMIVTSFPDSARGLLYDYGRANCVRGATTASVKSDTTRWLLKHYRGADQGAGKPVPAGPTAAAGLT